LVVGVPTLCLTSWGHDLPDADGPEFVSLNGGFREANRRRRKTRCLGADALAANSPFVEVALIPLFVNLVGVGWLAVGATIVQCSGGSKDDEYSRIVGPALALGLTLLLFQFVLRPGIAF
jgi:hypothetical protein